LKVDDKNRYIIRKEPTTGVQKADVWIQDVKHFIIRYKWIIIAIIFIIILIPLIYYISVSENIKEALVLFFKGTGNFLLDVINVIFDSLGALIFAFGFTYFFAKKLLSRQKILFEEFNGEKMPLLTMRKTADEIILYKNRDSFLATLLKGKLKIHVNHETYDLLESVGEKKVLSLTSEEHDVLRVYILPESEMNGEKLFLQNKDGDMTFNTNYLMDRHDIEEYILKSQLPGVNPDKLRNTLVNLTKKNNHYRQSIARLEKETEDSIERQFWDYLVRQTPHDSYGKQLLRRLWKEERESTDGEPDELDLEEYVKHLQKNSEIGTDLREVLARG